MVAPVRISEEVASALVDGTPLVALESTKVSARDLPHAAGTGCHVLGAIAEATAGESIPANLALAENNAVVATEIAAALVRLGAIEGSANLPAERRDHV